MPSELFRTFLSWALILPAAFLAGSFFQSFIRQTDLLLRGILYYALGFAVLSYGVIVLSLLHLLTPAYIWILLFLPVVFRIHKLGEWVQWFKELARDLFSGASFFSQILLGLFAVSFICLLLGTLTPELGGDALCYQLNLPKVFLAQGSIAPNTLDYNSFFPLLMNNLFLIGLATGGLFASKLFHFFFGFLLLATIFRVLKNETRNYALSLFIALVVWTTPTVYNLLSTAYIDVGLTFYTFLAVITFATALKDSSKKMFFLSGLLLGCGISIKYLCLISVLGLACVWLYSLVTTRRARPLLWGAFFFAAGILIVAGYWLVRNGLVTGNPFFPYFGSWFGVESRPQPDFSIFGFGRSWFNYISLYFDMFASPTAFGTFSARIGGFYFLLMPFALLALIFVPRSRGYGIFWLAFTTVIFFIAPADRWILPVLPLMCLSAGYGIDWLFNYASPAFKKLIKWGGGGLAIAILCFYVAAGAYHYRYAYLLFTGQWSISKYLTSLERTTTMSQWINQNLPADAKILFDTEARLFYFDRPVVRQVFLEWQIKNPTTLSDPAAFANVLRHEKITHVLARTPLEEKTSRSGISSAVEGLLASPYAQKIREEASRNIRENQYRYQLFELTEAV